MKYVRTKDGIIPDRDKYLRDLDIEQYSMYMQGQLREADTIEELCDEFVYKYVNPFFPNDKPSYELVSDMTLENMRLTMEMTSGATFYGAIWTDKGLIYKAKMKGVLPNGEIDWELL